MEKSFFGALFDVSFSSLITTRVIKVIYILSMILIGLTALVFVFAAFTDSVAAGLVTLLVFAPLAALVYLIYTRVILEVIICLFRIMETNVELVGAPARRDRPGHAAAPPEPPPAAPPPAEPPSSTPPPVNEP